jgi:signal transduction histidine kinase/GAF domain-containing protein
LGTRGGDDWWTTDLRCVRIAHHFYCGNQLNISDEGPARMSFRQFVNRLQEALLRKAEPEKPPPIPQAPLPSRTSTENLDSSNDVGPQSREAIAQLLRITTAADTTNKKLELMALAQSWLASDDGYCVLWLYDQTKKCLYPQYMVPTELTDAPSAKELADILVYLSDTNATETNKLADFAIGHLRAKLEPDNLDKEKGLRKDTAVPYNRLVPAVVNDEFIGVLQLHTSKDLSSEECNFLNYLTGALGRTILRVRQTNRLTALQQLQTDVGESATSEEHLKVMTKIIFDICEPEICIAFQRGRDQRLTAVASEPPLQQIDKHVAQRDSFLSLVAEQKMGKRIVNFQDQEERTAVMGKESYDMVLSERISLGLKDQTARSWYAVPVVSEERTHAVVMLINKQETNSFCRRITQNDEIIVESLAMGIRSTIARSEMYRCMTSMAEHVFSGTLEVETSLPELYTLLVDLIPGIDSALIKKTMPGGKQEQIFLGGAVWPEDLDIPAGAQVDPVPYGSPSKEGRQLFVYAPEMPTGDTGLKYRLALGLTSASLTTYEKRALEVFCTQMGIRLTAKDLVSGYFEVAVNIRHIIRGQLTGALGNIALLFQYGQEAKRRNDKDAWIIKADVHKALERSQAFAGGIVKLLDTSRALMTGVKQENLRLGSTLLPGLVSEVCFAVRFLAMRRNIEIKVSNFLEAGRRRYSMDRGLMEIVFHNLLDNAIKYSYRDREIEIRVGERSREWYVSVIDTGVYIAPEDRKRIFEPFVRRPTGPSAAQRMGTGIGLSFVRDIVHAHGGRIEVQSDLISKPEDGDEISALTCFTVSIPKEINRTMRN